MQQVIGQLKAAHVASEREALKALSAAVFRATRGALSHEEIAKVVGLSRISVLKVVKE